MAAENVRVIRAQPEERTRRADASRGVPANDNARQFQAANDNSRSGTVQTLPNVNRARALRQRVEAAKGGAHELMAKARAVRVSLWIAGFLLPFYIIQLSFGILALLGAGAEYAGESILWGAGAWIVPGDLVWGVANIITTTVAVLLMGAAAFIYTFSGVKWWSGMGLVWFIACLVFCFVPFLNMFPILAIWIVAVIYSQK